MKFYDRLVSAKPIWREVPKSRTGDLLLQHAASYRGSKKCVRAEPPEEKLAVLSVSCSSDQHSKVDIPPERSARGRRSGSSTGGCSGGRVTDVHIL